MPLLYYRKRFVNPNEKIHYYIDQNIRLIDKMTAIVWFRRDLRLQDNPALAKACEHHKYVIPLYIRDDDTCLSFGDAQTWWLHHSLKALKESLAHYDLSLILRKGNIDTILNALIKDHSVEAVYWNVCYEPKQLEQDKQLKQALQEKDINVKVFNGGMLHKPNKIQTTSGEYYKVFTPFWKKCLQELHAPKALSLEKGPTTPDVESDSLDSWELRPTQPDWASKFSTIWQPGEQGALARFEDFVENALCHYKRHRDRPDKKGTSTLSPHLHFGEISPWHIWRTVQSLKSDKNYSTEAIDVFLSEIGWREFSYHLLYHFPKLDSDNFQAKFDAFSWSESSSRLKAWQEGKTGYPIVDAGMRELWETGYMHNRVRMIVASFLTKDLLIDWREGAAWFFYTLLDADLASNSASWQWVAGSGADAAPYFRIFNPVLQGEKFDPNGTYVKKWIPALSDVPNKWVHKPWEASASKINLRLGKDYPKPIVDHQDARKKALELYDEIKDK